MEKKGFVLSDYAQSTFDSYVARVWVEHLNWKVAWRERQVAERQDFVRTRIYTYNDVDRLLLTNRTRTLPTEVVCCELCKEPSVYRIPAEVLEELVSQDKVFVCTPCQTSKKRAR